MAKAPAHRQAAQPSQPSILWSIAVGIALALIVVGAVVTLLGVVSPGVSEITLSPTKGLTVKAQTAGPLLLAVGAGLIICFAALLSNKIRVLAEGPDVEPMMAWQTRLRWMGWPVLIIGVVLLVARLA